jgi:hypothetical protein
MLRILFGIFLIAHGLVHAAVYATPKVKGAPFDPTHSWLLSALGLGQEPSRLVSLVMALAAMLGFVISGVGMFANQPWWVPLAVASALVSLVLVVLYFNVWLSLAVLLNAAIAAALLWTNWPSEVSTI